MADEPFDAGSPDLLRRKHVRHEKTAFVWYKVIDDSDDAESNEGLSYAEDISVGGLGIVVKKPVPVGRFMLTQIALDNRRLTVACKVVYCRETAELYTIGLKFVAVPPDTVQFLTEHYG